MNLFGIEVIEHPLAVMRVPIRKHKRRAWMSDSYHRRVQKKWTKRWGTREEPCALFISPSAVGLPWRDALMLHPKAFALLRGLDGSSNDTRK